MTIEIGKTKITVTLDTAQAKADLEKIKGELRSQEKTAKTVVQKIGRQSTSPSGTVSGTGGTNKAQSSIAQRLAELAQSRLAGSNKAAGAVTGVVGGQVVRAFTGSGGFAGAAIKGVGTAAALYGIASEGVKIGTLLDQFVNAALPDFMKDNPIFKGLEVFKQEVKNKFIELESKVMSSISAVQSAGEVAFGGALVTGLPGDYGFYYNLERKSGEAQRNLEQKFNEFRKYKIAGAMGKALGDGVRRSFNK